VRGVILSPNPIMEEVTDLSVGRGPEEIILLILTEAVLKKIRRQAYGTTSTAN